MFKPTFDSLYGFKAPEWYVNAKFGIWAHWGPQSVPEMGDWYAKGMYVQGSPQYEYHVKKYGHPSVFGYKDLCKLWKAENFDPDALMDIYVGAGAKFFAAQAMHHDNFFNYESRINPMNSVNVGPRKDILRLWQEAARKKGLPFGATEHLAPSFSWWVTNKGADSYGEYAGVPYDGNDPEWRAFYHDNYEHVTNDPKVNIPWCTTNPEYHKSWQNCIDELIDSFDLDFLYSDASLPFGRHWANKGASHLEDRAYEPGLEVVSRLYNRSIERHGENRALYLQKNRGSEIYRIGVLDMERSVLTEPSPYPWNTDTCIGNWFYDYRAKYKQPDQLIEMLTDIVSKNGSLLLSVPIKPDGTLDRQEKYILAQMGGWLKLNGAGIYGSRPYRVAGEGDTQADAKEGKTDWKAGDVRYTQKDGKVYAFLMKAMPGSTMCLGALGGAKVTSAVMPEVGELTFEQALGKTLIKLPEKLPTPYVNMIEIAGENL